MPDVVDIEHHRCHSFQAKTEREARVNGRINAAGAQHVWVDHSRASKLDPARAFARAAAVVADAARSMTDKAREIEFGRRFGEREVRRAEACPRVGAEEASEPFGDGPFEMSHC